MKATISAMQLALTALRAELMAVDWWTNTSPSEAALNSQEPFCVDHLTFSQWLQWVYIPKMQRYMQEKKQIPSHSGLYSIAEEAWRGCEAYNKRLLALMQILDDLCNQKNVEHSVTLLAQYYPQN